ncbi:hypothetical protein ACWEFL_21445 [Streptomyces sp. NPDC004838]
MTRIRIVQQPPHVRDLDADAQAAVDYVEQAANRRIRSRRTGRCPAGRPYPEAGPGDGRRRPGETCGHKHDLDVTGHHDRPDVLT